jgi:ribonuclease HII
MKESVVTDEMIRLHSLSIKELKERFQDADSSNEKILLALERDPRSGARHLAMVIRRHHQAILKEDQRLENLLRYETELQAQGFQKIAGVDEAGMAPLAGPVVAAAVILPQGYKLKGLDDSKKITNASKREELALRIKEEALSWSVGQTESEEIDRINIYRAGLLAMNRAVSGLQIQPDYLLVDARKIPNISCPQKGIIHGDALSASIAAASIIAKTTRDRYMTELDGLYPGYGLATHKGYPTPEHLAALKAKGTLPIHRKSFAPVRDCLGQDPVQCNFLKGLESI